MRVVAKNNVFFHYFLSLNWGTMYIFRARTCCFFSSLFFFCHFSHFFSFFLIFSFVCPVVIVLVGFLSYVDVVLGSRDAI